MTQGVWTVAAVLVTVSAATGALSALGTGALVLISGPTRAVNRWFGLLASILGLWCIGAIVVNLSDSAVALGWMRINEIFIVNIPSVYFAFASALVAPVVGSWKRQRRLVVSLLCAGLAFSFVAVTPFFVTGLRRYPWGYFPQGGFAHHLFDLYFVAVALLMMITLTWARAKSTGHLRLQTRYVILASIIGFGSGALSLLPFYGIPLPSLSFAGLTVAMILVAYAIVRHRLMDIEVVIRKGVVYSIITALFAGTYFAVLHVAGERIQELTGLRSVWPPLVAIVALAIAFEPMRNGLQSVVDRVFFKTKYEYQDEIRKFSQMVVTILDLDILLNQTVNTVKDILKIDRALLLLYEKADKRYRVAAFAGADESVARVVSFGERSRLVQNLQRESENIALEVDAGRPGSITAISLFIKNDLIGFLILGEKLSGDPYSRLDLELLTTLANQLSVAIENARLYRAAVTDELTKLFDQAYFYQRLDEELARSKGHGTSLSLIIVDLDKFSAFAHSRGRAAANKALVSVGRLMREAARSFDVPARVGEDEFAIILPGMRAEEVALVAARLRKRISAIKVGKDAAPLSASTGYACGTAGNKKKDALVNEARLSLFEAREKRLSELL